jgi:hypothetical protein
MEVKLTTSELAALRTVAGYEGYLPTKWVVAVIRTKLTGQPHVGQLELQRLTRSNQQLLALGRNLNQSAKVLNTSPQNRDVVREEVITELSRVIRAHTEKVSDVLRGTVERWQLRWVTHTSGSISDWTSGGVGCSTLHGIPPRPRRSKRTPLGSPKPVSAGGRLSTPQARTSYVRQTLQAMVRRAPQVMVKLVRAPKGMKGISDNLTYISLDGLLELEDQDGQLKPIVFSG